MHSHGEPQHDHPAHERANDSDIAMAELLELDAEVLYSHLSELIGCLADLTDRAPIRILDLGSGPGTGTVPLALQFPAASVTALDISPQMLHRLEKQAMAHGVADRVRTQTADLNHTWPPPEHGQSYDLIWTASFLHHLDDPGRGLTQAFSALRPGGLLAVTEMDFFPRVLPDDAGIGSPELEERLHAATNIQPPHEWSQRLERTGFILEVRRSFDIRLDSAQTGPALNRYAQLFLTRLRSHAEDALAVEDLIALDTLLDPAQPRSIARRRDLNIRTTRTTWVARRP